MPPTEPSWEELTWSWARSTGRQASDQMIEAAAKAAWPFAVLCAWIYLSDQSSAHELMDHAVSNASQYLIRHQDTSTDKLTARIRSVLKRRAQQIAAKHRNELPSGSMTDLEAMISGESRIEEQIYASQLLSFLSPFAQSIAQWRWHGYTWREIAQQLDTDHTVVRRAYLRELKSVFCKHTDPRGGPK